ncbi:hypothetical protein EV210_101173 [Anaerospora hongkongensis]|uniref:Uncharacterized protein n=1 Tax=Anaerospora hongkongensis TaxID=244830 RepID=A0A4V2Q932_9FIRM|nr:hypothetical protein [Anaerospora hongkongensis]TCL39973.1 hypothetical protein EV210_101173 [Anaerospora hongkongensis]
MQRFWASWYSGNYADEGCTKPPFKFWISGYSDRNDDSGRDDCAICAVIDATDEEAVWRVVEKHFPDFKKRFCDKKEADYVPGGRFQ